MKQLDKLKTIIFNLVSKITHHKFKMRYMLRGTMLSFPIIIIINMLMLWGLSGNNKTELSSLRKDNHDLIAKLEKIIDEKGEIIKQKETIIKDKEEMVKEMKEIKEKELLTIEDKIRYIQNEVVLAEKLTDNEIEKMAKAIQENSKKINIQSDWILAILWNESNCRRVWYKNGKRAWYISSANAIGPAQLMIYECKEVCRILGLKFPKSKEEQIKFACDPENCIVLLCGILKEYGISKSVRKSTIRYNGKEKYYADVSEKFYKLIDLK